MEGVGVRVEEVEEGMIVEGMVMMVLEICVVWRNVDCCLMMSAECF